MHHGECERPEKTIAEKSSALVIIRVEQPGFRVTAVQFVRRKTVRQGRALNEAGVQSESVLRKILADSDAPAWHCLMTPAR